MLQGQLRMAGIERFSDGETGFGLECFWRGKKHTAACPERVESSPHSPCHRGLVPVSCEDLQAHFNSDEKCNEEQLYSLAPVMIPHSTLAHESRGKESCRKASRDCLSSYAAFPERTGRN